MSSTACQGLQSCLVETPRALRFKLAPSVPNPSPVTVSGHGTHDSEWLRNCFFQSPFDRSSPIDGKVPGPEYVHPLTKRRLSMLSDKSLEMCTESLGSETGSHVGDYYVSPATVQENEKKPKKLNRAQSFPPPLKSTGLQVRPRREEGRLVLEAVTTAEWNSIFHVERSEGRIRVEMVRDSVEETVGDGEGAEVDDSVSGEGGDMDGNIVIIEGELGIEKLSRPRSCMKSQRQSNKDLLNMNWESFLVTI